MLYIIGLGLNVEGISKFGLETVRKCKRVYLESYTVDLPYSKGELEHVIGKKLIEADREKVESLSLVDEAQKMDIALLVYGSPLTATTHITLIDEAKKSDVRYKVIYNASVFDAVAETGLQLYKFGKIASIPEFEADSFMEVVRENQSIKAHSLILVDIGIKFQDALKKLEKAAKKYKVKLNKIVLCITLGGRGGKILYRSIDDFKKFEDVEAPYCFIIPSKLHFIEKEVLENL